MSQGGVRHEGSIVWDAALDHGVGDLGLHAAHDLVDQVVLDLLVSLLLMVGLDALADGVPYLPRR